MSWKNVKEAYQIEHIVQIRDGMICIGSPYVSDILRITPTGVISWGTLGPSKNDDLVRYHAEMSADLPKLRKLIEAPDTFTNSLPVFTFEGGEITEKQCEVYGWPNVTHDGLLMYENSFSREKAEVVKWAKENAAAGVEMSSRRIAQLREDLSKAEEWRAKETEELAKLNRDFPEESLHE